MGKFLALDIGEKRVGIAHSDDSGSFVFPYKTLSVEDNIESQLKAIIKEEKPERIVVGLPRNMDGTLGFQAEKVKEFVKSHLAGYDTLVDYEDESVTSIEAEKIMQLEGKNPQKNKAEVDAYAAKIILESYIKRQ